MNAEQKQRMSPNIKKQGNILWNIRRHKQFWKMKEDEISVEPVVSWPVGGSRDSGSDGLQHSAGNLQVQKEQHDMRRGLSWFVPVQSSHLSGQCPYPSPPGHGWALRLSEGAEVFPSAWWIQQSSSKVSCTTRPRRGGSLECVAVLVQKVLQF